MKTRSQLPYFHDYKAHINVLDFFQNVQRALSSRAPYLCANVVENHDAADMIENKGALKGGLAAWIGRGLCIKEQVCALCRTLLS